MDDEELTQDLDIMFNDLTINESDCERKSVEYLMGEDVRVNEWMLESEVGISNGVEESFGILQFWSNGEAILKEYMSGFTDEIVPVDAIFLQNYLKEKGWDFILSEELVEGTREYWDKFFSIVEEDDMEEFDDEYPEEDFYGDEENFFEYAERMKEYRKPTANKYNMLSTTEFANHEYDFGKRTEREEENKF